MDLFRRKQKLIFWIVTLIIVPSFVLVWGVSGVGGPDNSYAGFEMGRVDGHAVKFEEYDAFRRRLQAALGGIGFQFSGAPGINTPSEEVWKHLFTMALLNDAKKAGSEASSLQIGTYLRNGHPSLSVHGSDDKALDSAINVLCNQLDITRADFMRGIREWQTIGNYLDADSNLTAVTDATAYAFYAISQAEVEVKRVQITETDDIRDQARRDIVEKPADELEREVRAYAARNGDQRRYRDPSGWRFAWVLTPHAPDSSMREPTDTDIEEFYQANRTYLYSGQPLDDVRDLVKAAVRREEAERQTLRNFQIDIDPQLRRQGDDSVEELVKLTPLAKYGVTAGTTGDEPLPPAALHAALPAGTDIAFRTLLEDLDDAFTPEQKESMLREWQDGWLLDESPFKADNGYYRLRLLEYRPSVPSAIDAEDGSIRPEIFEMAVADMVRERALQLTEDAAREMETKLHALLAAREKNEDVPDAETAELFDAIPAETITYMELGDAKYGVGRMELGHLLGPMAFEDAENGLSGQEIVVMVGRRLPSREMFEAESAETKSRFRQVAASSFRGGLSFSYSMAGPIAVIQPSPTVMKEIADRFNAGRISINPALLTTLTEG